MTKRKKLYIVAGLIFLVLLAGLFISKNKTTDNKVVTPPVAVAKVIITSNGFGPTALSVKKGTKIVWVNKDEHQHQIYANPHPTGASLPSLKSGLLNNSQTYEYTAIKAGSFGYHDQLNPTINGTLQINE